MRIVIINPTYNERNNIPVLVKRIAAVKTIIDKRHNELLQLIVDDHSPDGTAKAVRKLQKEYPFIHLIEGRKQGLGEAYKRGFRYAIDSMHADVIVMMDADLQHEPEILPPMLDKFFKGNDVVIGSRYIPGGSYPKEWSWFRVLNSKVANILARDIAGLSHVHDCTSGYRIIKVHKFLDTIDLKKIPSKGYSFQLTLLNALIQQKAKVYEYPMDFKERYAGQSKIAFNKTYIRDIMEFFKNAVIIRIKKITQHK